MISDNQTKWSMRLLLVALYLLVAIDGFIPSSIPRSLTRQLSLLAENNNNSAKTSTVERVPLMTTDDEEILFGDETNSEIDAEYKSDHRSKDIYGNILPDPTKKRAGRWEANGASEKLLIKDLDHVPDNPLVNKLRTVRDTVSNCPQLWIELSEIMPNERALYDDHLCDTKVDWTFEEATTLIKKSAAVFCNIFKGKATKHVAIFAENSAYWLLVDHGIQMAGGVSAVRGADAPIDELRYIYSHSDSTGTVVLQDVPLLQKLYKDAKQKKLKEPLGLSNELNGPVKTVILMHRGRKNIDTSEEFVQQVAAELNIKVVFFNDLLENATPLQEIPTVARNDLSTIVYTSGTTGSPKGVMLTHGNLLHQITHRLAPTKPYSESEPLPGETMASILPVWHITERTFELWMLSRGCNVVYSTVRTFKKDLATHKPHWVVLVPRVLEKIAAGVQEKFATSGPAVKALSKFFTNIGKTYATNKKILSGLIVDEVPPGPLEKLAAKAVLTTVGPLHAVGQKLVWSKVQEGFGGRLRTIIAGGSALAGGLETFYETAGLPVCVGYGLTECSPLLSYRRSDSNLVTGGCVGKACIDTEVRVVDPEVPINGNKPRPAVPNGQVGLVLGRGPQVMKGYYKNPEATAKALDKYGWFDTGDLGRINPATGDLILTGRVKDTIVLSNGENIEPVPIEDAILGDVTLVDQVMLTTAGVGSAGDGRGLIAITVLNPQELFANGFLSNEELKQVTEAMEIVNSPQCSTEDCERVTNDILLPTTKNLRANPAVAKLLSTKVRDVLTASKKFRKWELVQDFCITMEPFAMVNGQLTQSYKVKRPQVAERYQKELTAAA